MTHLGELVQAHIDAQQYPPSERALASRIGIAQSGLAKWRKGPLSRVPDVDNLRSAARVLGVPYRVVLNAALHDAGYLEEVGDDARSAANRQAAERAANIEALRGPDPSGLDLAAETEERRGEE